MKSYLIDLCKTLDPKRSNKCDEYFTEFFDIWKIIFESNFIIPIIIIFLFIIILILKQSNRTLGKENYYLIYFITILFLLILFNLRTNIPWVDDWEWIENLLTKEKSTFEWLNQPTNIHNIFFVKLIFFFVNNFLNLNMEFFNYLSVFLTFCIGTIYFKKEKNINNIYMFLILVIIFSGKQFANFSQSCNIVWSICFIYVISYYYLVDKDDKLSVSLNSLIIFIAPLTFGLGYVISFYNILFIYFHKINTKIKINYLLIAIISLILAIYLPKIYFSEVPTTLANSDYLSFKNLINYKIYFTFFSVISNVYLPWVDGFAYLGVLIGFVQFCFLIILFYKHLINSNNKNILKFFSQNTLLSIGLIFALLVSITRSDLQTTVAARYSVGSIIFQIGFWKLIFENYKHNFIFNNYTIKILTIYVFLLGILSPYHGIHWQAKRYKDNNIILDCFKSDKNLNKCSKLAYDILFYGGKWYDYNDFENQIKILKNQKKSFLNF